MTLSINRSPLRNRTLTALDRSMLGEEGEHEAEALLLNCPSYAPTPLVELPRLAIDLGVASISVKDEASRLGLGSFKALGGAYAVLRFVLEQIATEGGFTPDPKVILNPEIRRFTSSLTVACATDGNHGRSLAAGARLAGCEAVIFVPSNVSNNRIAAIADLGARIERVDGSYDDAVDASRNACEAHGWSLISDTSWGGYEETPLRVMQGYTIMAAEVLREIAKPPTHLFVQAGVGGLAAAVAAHFACRLGHDCPKVIVVEPSRAACVFESHSAQAPVRIEEAAPTVMSMLECYQVSLVAWRILMRLAEAFMTVSEEDAVFAMCTFARPVGNDPIIVSGESGAAGLAGLQRACKDRRMRRKLGLTPNSRVLLLSTEGATDPDLYHKLSGCGASKNASFAHR